VYAARGTVTASEPDLGAALCAGGAEPVLDATEPETVVAMRAAAEATSSDDVQPTRRRGHLDVITRPFPLLAIRQPNPPPG